MGGLCSTSLPCSTNSNVDAPKRNTRKPAPAEYVYRPEQRHAQMPMYQPPNWLLNVNGAFICLKYYESQECVSIYRYQTQYDTFPHVIGTIYNVKPSELVRDTLNTNNKIATMVANVSEYKEIGSSHWKWIYYDHDNDRIVDLFGDKKWNFFAIKMKKNNIINRRYMNNIYGIGQYDLYSTIVAYRAFKVSIVCDRDIMDDKYKEQEKEKEKEKENVKEYVWVYPNGKIYKILLDYCQELNTVPSGLGLSVGEWNRYFSGQQYIRGQMYKKQMDRGLPSTNDELNIFDTMHGFADGDEFILHDKRKNVIPVNQAKMEIYIKTMTGKTINLMVSHEYTIFDTKYLIYKIENIQIDLQRLIFGGKQLDDNHKLQDYNISKGAALYLTLSLKGME